MCDINTAIIVATIGAAMCVLFAIEVFVWPYGRK